MHLRETIKPGLRRSARLRGTLPKKLRAWIEHHYPQVPMLAPSTIGEILRRRGLTVSQLRRPRSTHAARQPFADVTGANARWCTDFKGHFATGDGRRGYPLTIIDAYSSEYNEERPHEALGQVTPSSVFARSPRRYPRPLVTFVRDAPWIRRVHVDKHGSMDWNDGSVFIAQR